jgi:hypothetical protein
VWPPSTNSSRRTTSACCASSSSRRAIATRPRVGRRKHRHRLLDHSAGLRRQQPVLGDAVPSLRKGGPVPRPRGLVRGEEPLRVDRGLGRLLGGSPRAAERGAPPLPLPRRPGLVQQDPEQPGPERGAPLEPVDASKDTEPRLLDDVLGDLPGGDVHPGHPDHRAVVLLDQEPERGLVPVAQRLDESVVRRERRPHAASVATRPGYRSISTARGGGRLRAMRGRFCSVGRVL